MFGQRRYVPHVIFVAVLAALGIVATSAQAAPAADLSISRVTPAFENVQVGNRVRVTYTLRNAGGRTAPVTTTRFYLSADDQLSRTDRLLGSARVRAIGAERRLASAASLRVAAATSTGTYFVIACANTPSRVVETNARNNCTASPRNKRLTVGPRIARPAAPSVTPSLPTERTTTATTVTLAVRSAPGTLVRVIPVAGCIAPYPRVIASATATKAGVATLEIDLAMGETSIAVIARRGNVVSPCSAALTFTRVSLAPEATPPTPPVAPVDPAPRDTTSPIVAVSRGASQTSRARTQPLQFDIAFDEPVTGLDETDLVLGGTAGRASAVLGLTGSGAAYVATVSGLTTSGTVHITIPDGAAVDAAGNPNVAATGTSHAVEFDATAPTLNVDAHDSLTNLATAGFSGTASDDVALAEVRWTNATAGTSGTATGTAAWSIAAIALQEGLNVIDIVAVDTAGNERSESRSLVRDSTPPASPADLNVNPTGCELVGTGELGAIVNVTSQNAASLGIASVQSDGAFTVNLVPCQTNGELLAVVATDLAGNVSGPGIAVAPDITPPASPTNIFVDMSGCELMGEGEPLTTAIVRDANGTAVGLANVAGDGSFWVLLGPCQINGGLLRVFLADSAGNNSPASYAVAPDHIPPDAPTSLLVSSCTLIGTAEVGTTITVRNDSAMIVGVGTVQPDGSFAVALSPCVPAVELFVVATDNAGNSSSAATVIAP